MPPALPVACDESGFTGPDLLNLDQRYFAFGSVTVDDNEAFSLIQRARQKHPVQMPELKASKLLQSVSGQALVLELLDGLEGKFAVNVFDKLLALSGWVFEYIYEPVYKKNPSILYEKNLHRFLAMFTWLWLQADKGNASEMIRQFQSYMRSRDEADAPLLFAAIARPLNLETAHPFELVLRFARGYRDVIIQDNADLGTVLPQGGRWVLDLSTSALWSHLNHWGQKGLPLRVQCDASKPLQANADAFIGDENDPAIRRARVMGFTGHLGWTFEAPLNFVDSRDHPAVQLADIVAGVPVTYLSRGVPQGFENGVAAINRHLLRDTVLPDYEVVDLKQRAAAVNFLVLYDLARRADAHADPYSNLAELYRGAEIAWVNGDFDNVRK